MLCFILRPLLFPPKYVWYASVIVRRVNECHFVLSWADDISKYRWCNRFEL